MSVEVGTMGTVRGSSGFVCRGGYYGYCQQRQQRMCRGEADRDKELQECHVSSRQNKAQRGEDAYQVDQCAYGC